MNVHTWPTAEQVVNTCGGSVRTRSDRVADRSIPPTVARTVSGVPAVRPVKIAR